MKLKNMSKEELEMLSYTDITYMFLKETKKPMNTPSIFKKICEMLDLSDEAYSDKIGDYYTSLTMDKRFLLLDNNEWDIRDNHSVEIVLDEDEDDDVEDMQEDEIEPEEEIEEDTVYDDENDLSDDDDDVDELSIIDEDELDED